MRDHVQQEHLGMLKKECVRIRDALVALTISYSSIALVAAYM